MEWEINGTIGADSTVMRALCRSVVLRREMYGGIFVAKVFVKLKSQRKIL